MFAILFLWLFDLNLIVHSCFLKSLENHKMGVIKNTEYKVQHKTISATFVMHLKHLHNDNNLMVSFSQ